MSFTIPAGSGSVASGAGSGPSGTGALAAGGSGVPVRASLQANTPVGIRLLQILEIILWLGVIAFAAIDVRRRRAEHPPVETVQAEWFAPMAPAAGRTRWQPGGTGALGADDITGDEVWIDV
jgi:hypothetical protein